MKPNWLVLFFTLGMFVSCGDNAGKKDVAISVNANSSCVLAIEGMMCEKGCKATIEQRLSATEGVVSCEVEYENKKVNLDFDNNFTSTNDLIDVVNTIADGIYSATLLEESVFLPAKGAGSVSGGEEVDEVSVSDYNFQLPDFTNVFPSLI